MQILTELVYGMVFQEKSLTRKRQIKDPKDNGKKEKVVLYTMVSKTSMIVTFGEFICAGKSSRNLNIFLITYLVIFLNHQFAIYYFL